MVRQQVRTWDVLDRRILDAMGALPRDRFVPSAYREVAFADSRIPLAHGQVMLAPKVAGRLLQGLALQPSDRVLEIGTGSGYVTACLSRLAAHVTSVDLFADLTAAAKAALAETGCNNVELRTADAFTLAANERYDAIAITGSLPVYDARFEQMLRHSGRLFVIVGHPPVMDARVVTRVGDSDWVTTSLFETNTPALINAPDPAQFRF
jgi:protein-L-isoaspartate(D-aspartate) O-methyltransferase